MKLNSNVIHTELERAYQKPLAQRSQTPQWTQQISKYLGRVGYQLVKFLAGNREPKITQYRDRHGNSYYEIYDPVSGNRHSCATEQEVRVWLEQRYTHDSR
jgi:hypothetical protein